MERRLAAIMAADVVGYSRLMGADEAVEWLDKALEMHSDTPYTVDIMRYWKAIALFAATDYADAAAVLGSISGLVFLKAGMMAACHVRLGQADRARARAADVLRVYPAYRVSHVRMWKTFRDDRDRQNLLNALLEAGLPD